MRIFCDENIREARAAFSTLGEVTLFRGRPVALEEIKDADILCVRSVTKIDAALLDAVQPRFVATATSGADHLDFEALKQRKIPFAVASGSNAVSVAEWVVAVLLLHARRNKTELQGKTLGIIGVGQVGSRVANFAKALGMQPVLCDPPRAEREKTFQSATLNEALACDFITLHPNLSHEGIYKTFHLLGEKEILRIKPGAVLIQASRGAVIDSAPLKNRLLKARDLDYYADVFEGEPMPDKDILCCAQISTPHIAGYSWDGKLRGTEMIYKAVCDFLGAKPSWQAPYSQGGTVEIDLSGLKKEKALAKAVFSLYNPESDDALLCPVLDLGDSKRGAYFDDLRKNYKKRLEFSHGVVSNAAPEEAATLKALGFTLAL